MKILAITDSYPPHHTGGYELRCKDIFESLIQRGYQIFVITTVCPKSPCVLHPSEKVIARILRKNSVVNKTISRILWDLIEVGKIQEIYKKVKPDIIHLSHVGDLSSAVLLFCLSRDIPIVIDDGGACVINFFRKIHTSIYTSKLPKNICGSIKRIFQSFFRSLLGIKYINTSKEVYAYFNSYESLLLAEKYNIKSPTVIYSGIDINAFSIKTRKFIEPIKILIPGRISPIKGVLDGVFLVKSLLEQNIDATLTIVGQVDSEEYFSQIENEIKLNSLQSVVKILPKVEREKLVTLYQSTSICFFPSYQKFGFSRVPIEAMACGSILITYGNEGAREIVRNYENGFVVDEGDIMKVVDIIKWLISNNQSYIKVVDQARKYVESRHSLSAYIDEVENYLKKCLV